MKNKRKIILTVVLGMFCLYSNVFGQNITMSSGQTTVKSAMEKLEKEYGYSFVFESNDVNTKKTISINAQNTPLEDVIKQILKDQSVSYEIINKNIIVKKRSQINRTQNPEQKLRVSGTVVDDKGEIIIGASVVVKGTTTGTITDLDGKFEIEAPQGSQVEISFMGYINQTIQLKRENLNLEIILRENTELLDEVVVVGYGVQKKINKTASVSSLNADEIKSMPVSNISNAMGGKISGLITRQTSGEPGSDASALYLRGNNPYVLVDGIEREWNKINMEEVESVTLLKDASAVAPYGLRGANGVVLITTKRGQAGKLSVSYNADFSYQKPTNLPSLLSSSEGLKLKRQAWIMDGQEQQAATITDEMLANYAIGSDQYPNTDWVNEYLKSSVSQRHSIVLSGGNDAVKAHVVLGYLNQGNMLGRDFDYSRYNLRSNVDIKATPITNIGIDVSFSSDKKNANIISASEAMQYIYRAKSTEANVYSNGLPAFVSSIGTSVDQMIKGGGDKTNSNTYQNINLSLNQNLPFIKGLSFKFNFNYNTQREEYKYWREPMISYIYDPSTETYNEDNEWNRYKPSLSLGNTAFTYYTGAGLFKLFKSMG